MAEKAINPNAERKRAGFNPRFLRLITKIAVVVSNAIRTKRAENGILWFHPLQYVGGGR